MPRTDFGQDEHDSLEYDENSVQDSPKGSASLVRNGAVSRMSFIRNQESFCSTESAYGT